MSNRERETSQVTESLVNRIGTNNTFGDVDLTSWLWGKIGLFEGEKILEIGCGTGKHLIEFARILGEANACVGIDISNTHLNTAMEAAAEAGVRVKWIQRSMDDLDDFTGAYDTVMIVYALYYSLDPQRVLENAKRLLKPGGRLVIMGPYNDNNKSWFTFLEQFMSLPQEARKSGSDFMYNEVVKFALKNFGDVTMSRFVNTIVVPGKEDLKKYWQSNIYYKEEFDQDFDKYADAHFGSNDSFKYDKVGLFVKMQNKI